MNVQKLKVKVKEIIKHDVDVFSVFFEISKKSTRFRAGQFMHLTLEDFDPTLGFWPESRVFSICTIPKSDVIGIVYSVKGRYTKRMRDELRVGDEVWIKLPYGEFIIDSLISPDDSVVLIAGGTGISPFIPFLLSETRSGSERKLQLYYGIRASDHYLFGDDLKVVQEELHNAIIDVFVENIDSGTLDSGFLQGRLSIERIWKEEFLKNNSKFFLSGPPLMIQYFNEELQKLGVSKQSIFIDAWE